MKAWWMLLAVLPVGALAAPAVQDFVPQGWKLTQQAAGDLNGDGRADKVLVLQQQNTANWRDNEALGAPRLNLNPRTLLVLWNTPQGYREAVRNTTLLPSETVKTRHVWPTLWTKAPSAYASKYWWWICIIGSVAVLTA